MFFYLLTITNPKGVYRWVIWRRENLVRLLEASAASESAGYIIKPVHHTPNNIRSWAPPEVHWFDSPRWS